MRSVSIILLLCAGLFSLEVELATEDTQAVYDRLSTPTIAKKLFQNKLTAQEVETRYKIETDQSQRSSKESRKNKEGGIHSTQNELDALKKLQSVLHDDSFLIQKDQLQSVLEKSLYSQYSTFTLPVEYAYVINFDGEENEALDEMLAQITAKILLEYGMSQTKHAQKLENMQLKEEITQVNMYGTVEKNQAASFTNKRQYTKNSTMISGVSSLQFYPFQLHQRHYSKQSASSSVSKAKGIKVELVDITKGEDLSPVTQGLSDKSKEKILEVASKSTQKHVTEQVSYANIRKQLAAQSNQYKTLMDDFFKKYPECETLSCVEQSIRDKMTGLKELNHGKTVIYIKTLPDTRYEDAVDVVIKGIVKELERSSKILALNSKETLSSSSYEQTQTSISTKPVYEKAELQLYYTQEALGILIKFYISYNSNLFCANFVKETNYDHLLDMNFMETKVNGDTKSLYIGEKEISQKAYFKFMDKTSLLDNCPIEEGDNYPISCLSVDSVKQFIKILNKKSKDFRYRLPDCDEWMFIATCNNKQKYCWGNSEDYKEYENIAESKYGFDIAQIASYKPNAIGLYDMCGNAREFCEYNKRIRSIGSSHYSLEPIITKYRLGPSMGLRLTKEKK